MTRRQRDVLEFVRGYLEREGWAPTVREIAAGVGLASPSTVQRHLAALVRAGAIELGPPGRNKGRMIRIPRKETTQ